MSKNSQGRSKKTRQSIAVPISTREPKHNVNQSVATSSKKTIATDSIVKKSRNITRKLYEQVSKTCSWWYPKYTPSGYKWKPKSDKGNVNPNVSMPLGNASRTANILEYKTPRCSTVSNTPLSSNSFAARDLVQGAITIKWVYYVKGLNHNLFSIGQFCDADLEVAFRFQSLKYSKIIRVLLVEFGKPKDRLFHTKDYPELKKTVTILHMTYVVPIDKEHNGKKYVLVIVDTLPDITWTHFLRSKDEKHPDSGKVSSDPGPQCSTTVLEQDSLSPGPQSQENVPQVAETVTTSNELELLYSLMFSELLNGNSPVVSKSSVVHAADNPDKRQQHNTTHTSTTTDVADPPPLNIQSTHQTPTQVPTVTAPENIIQAETNTENAQFDDDEFINIFSNPVQERGETSTRRQLETDGEMCMFALTVSRTKPKNIKEAMADSAWIKSMQEELHQFDRLDVWELVDIPLCKNVINLKWLWKNKRDEENTIIRNKSRLVAKGYAQKEGIDFEELIKYAQEILKKHGMPIVIAIGTLMDTKHLVLTLRASRPDIVHATCYCARYQAKPTEKHLTAVKRIFWYLKDSINMGLWYPKETGFELTAFSDSDHAGCLDSRKSTSGGIQFLGGDKLVSWSSKTQDCTSISSAEAEYVSLSACCVQVLWLRTQLIDYGFNFDKIPIYHFIKEQVKKGIVELFFVEIEYQLADLFTKALSEDRFKYLVRRIVIVDIEWLWHSATSLRYYYKPKCTKSTSRARKVRQNDMQNDGYKVGQNAVQNPGIQNVENMNGLSVVPEIENQYGNGNIAQDEEVGIQNTQEEFEFMAATDAYEETERVKVNCTLEDTLQQASTSGTQSGNAPVYDSDGSTELDRMKEKLENCIIKKEKEYDVLWNNWYTKCEECKYNKISYDKAYNDMQQNIECLQAQLGDLKGKSSDTQCASNTLDRVSQKLKDENVSLEFQFRSYVEENEHLKTTYKNLFDSIKVTQAQTKSIIDSLQKQLYDTIYENAKLRAQLFDKVYEPKGTTKGTRTKTMFTTQSILGKPPSSYKPKLYSTTPFPKSSILPKVDKSNALSKPVTSNLAPFTRESKGVQTVNAIAPRILRTNPSKTSRVDNVVPNKPVKTSVRIKPIIVSQPNVIHKQQANSDSNGFSSTRVNNTAKTRRPHPRSNSNTNRVPSKSKSSCLSNKVEKIKENHKNSQIPKNQKHMSSECNNITLAIRNAKSEIVCVMCKQCLVTTNHDVCVLNYVNNMNSHADNQSANVTIREYQKKYKANAKNSKELRSKGSLASSRPSKPRTCLRWILTGRIFAMCGKLTASSDTENKSKKSMCDNASTSNPSEPSSKGFPISTSLLGRLSRLRKQHTSIYLIVVL
ncbi:retrovirus-related pol polyprotein from transposon TNT 1-94 [Tanacetum coccineum]